ncbi:MAG: hypothetical protein FWF09_04235 [Bacteroidales bacterium]|nr:hypothetical protein [Bacteroidales bacterium]
MLKSQVVIGVVGVARKMIIMFFTSENNTEKMLIINLVTGKMLQLRSK